VNCSSVGACVFFSGGYSFHRRLQRVALDCAHGFTHLLSLLVGRTTQAGGLAPALSMRRNERRQDRLGEQNFLVDAPPLPLLRGYLGAHLFLLLPERRSKLGTEVLRLEYLANLNLSFPFVGTGAALDPLDSLLH
jgi:hypothetical protein